MYIHSHTPTPHDPAQPSRQLFVLFSGICKPPKPKPESGSASALKHLSPSQLRKTKETTVVFPQLVLFFVIRNPVSLQTMAGTQRALTICQYHKLESECFGEESGLPPPNSKCIRWYVEVCRASYALYHENQNFRVLAARTKAETT